MTEPMVTKTLREVRDAVEVPRIDHVDFAARTRRLRRRRRVLQALGAGAAVAAVVGAVALPTVLRAPDAIVATPVPEGGVPVVLDGAIRWAHSDGTVTDTERSGAPVGVLDGELVSLDEGVLTGPGLRAEDVRAAYVAPDGVTYQDADGTIHPSGDRPPVAAEGRLVAAGDDTYVTQQTGTLTLHTEAGTYGLDTGSDGARSSPSAVEVGADVVMVAAGGVVHFFDDEGARTGGFLGGLTGALSPDGGTYAYAPDEQERARGMRPGLAFYDVGTDRTQRVRLDGAALDLAWVGDRLVVLTQRGDERVLTQCRGTSCGELLTDATGTLSLQ
ncbi:hypothetical protein [Nocardioides hwasunensis]|uniref:Twin-arginine translocation signal domain-containing protein n=1 Tax=Nocardioides hwasunensis TaxID=397258 RepID=A0ABR8MFM7_9ACTN|nr:hypothetical protein [Nocardioides hwasunensis]MBD3914703.1 hypothetical protein [Nocardioides hwasunensis]